MEQDLEGLTDGELQKIKDGLKKEHQEFLDV
jgi:hypothetical protein